MKIRESIDVDAPAEEVWPLIADPRRMAAWHQKLVTVERSALGPVRLGDRFRTTYVMSGRRQQASTEVIRCQPPIELTLRHYFTIRGRQHYVEESYDVVQQGWASRIDQAVDFREAGMPWGVRQLVRLVAWFGRAVGPGVLEPLKQAAERREH
jgi:uncharacterized protein YndB with AHSA1/START domain